MIKKLNLPNIDKDKDYEEAIQRIDELEHRLSQAHDTVFSQDEELNRLTDKVAELEQQVAEMDRIARAKHEVFKELTQDCNDFYNSYNDAVGKLVECEAERDHIKNQYRESCQLNLRYREALQDIAIDSVSEIIGIARSALEDSDETHNDNRHSARAE